MRASKPALAFAARAVPEAPAPPAPAVADEPVAEAPKAEAPARPVVGARRAPSLSEELAEVGTADDALKHGDVERAQELLEQHDKQFGKAMLGPETMGACSMELLAQLKPAKTSRAAPPRSRASSSRPIPRAPTRTRCARSTPAASPWPVNTPRRRRADRRHRARRGGAGRRARRRLPARRRTRRRRRARDDDVGDGPGRVRGQGVRPSVHHRSLRGPLRVRARRHRRLLRRRRPLLRGRAHVHAVRRLLRDVDVRRPDAGRASSAATTATRSRARIPAPSRRTACLAWRRATASATARHRTRARTRSAGIRARATRARTPTAIPTRPRRRSAMRATGACPSRPCSARRATSRCENKNCGESCSPCKGGGVRLRRGRGRRVRLRRVRPMHRRAVHVLQAVHAGQLRGAVPAVRRDDAGLHGPRQRLLRPLRELPGGGRAGVLPVSGPRVRRLVLLLRPHGPRALHVARGARQRLRRDGRVRRGRRRQRDDDDLPRAVTAFDCAFATNCGARSHRGPVASRG